MILIQLGMTGRKKYIFKNSLIVLMAVLMIENILKELVCESGWNLEDEVYLMGIGDVK